MRSRPVASFHSSGVVPLRNSSLVSPPERIGGSVRRLFVVCEGRGVASTVQRIQRVRRGRSARSAGRRRAAVPRGAGVDRAGARTVVEPARAYHGAVQGRVGQPVWAGPAPGSQEGLHEWIGRVVLGRVRAHGREHDEAAHPGELCLVRDGEDRAVAGRGFACPGASPSPAPATKSVACTPAGTCASCPAVAKARFATTGTMSAARTSATCSGCRMIPDTRRLRSVGRPDVRSTPLPWAARNDNRHAHTVRARHPIAGHRRAPGGRTSAQGGSRGQRRRGRPSGGRQRARRATDRAGRSWCCDGEAARQ